MPTFFLSHGGGPWPWLRNEMPYFEDLHRALVALPSQLPSRPKAILMISAHWEEDEFTVMTHPRPPMIYDYRGFPQSTYEIVYPAPGAPEVAARVREVASAAGVAVASDAERGFDHGTYALLYPVYPQADVPVVQLSMKHDYDPEEHFKLGHALAPLRKEGILIMGSGNSYHNFHPPADVIAQTTAFDEWLTDTLVVHAGPAREQHLKVWAKAPGARVAQPREDHLVPLFVAVGAAVGETGQRIHHEMTFGKGANSSFRFG